jgi:hypothetical protein
VEQKPCQPSNTAWLFCVLAGLRPAETLRGLTLASVGVVAFWYRIEHLMRRLHVLALLILAVPLLAGTCFFSSSSGDTKVSVTVGDCDSQEHPEPCTHDGEQMAASVRAHESMAFVVRRQMTPAAAVAAVPEPSSWLLFAVGVAVVFRCRQAAKGR